MNNSFFKSLAIGILMLMAPIEIKEHLLANVDTSLTDTVRVFPKVHIRRV